MLPASTIRISFINFFSLQNSKNIFKKRPTIQIDVSENFQLHFVCHEGNIGTCKYGF